VEGADILYGKICGKYLALYPVKEEDYPYIYKHEYDQETCYLWTNNREIHDFRTFTEEFRVKLKHFYHQYFMIMDHAGSKAVGVIFSYDYHRSDGHLSTTIFVDPEAQNGFIGVEAGILFYDYLFRWFSLRKIYSRVYGYNKRCLNFLKKGGFHEEGRLREYRYYDGVFHDVHVLAIDRESFFKRASLMKEWFGLHDDETHTKGQSGLF